jgi:hypothetical protein
MLDYNTKELIRTYHYNTAKEDRYYVKQEVINGRLYAKYGIATVASMVVDLWKIYDPSVKQYKYVYMGGLSRQHPNDTKIDIEMGYEVAHENAFTNPVFTFIYNEKLSTIGVLDLMREYVKNLPIEFIRTRQEIKISKK